MRQAEIYSNSILAGILMETDEGAYRFRYDDAFLADGKLALVPEKRKRIRIGYAVSVFLRHAHREGHINPARRDR